MYSNYDTNFSHFSTFSGKNKVNVPVHKTHLPKSIILNSGAEYKSLTWEYE